MLLPQTPARQRRRYSIQPFYLSLLVFTLLAIASLVFEKLENRLYIAATPKLRRRSLPDSSSLLKKSVVGQVFAANVCLMLSAVTFNGLTL